MPLVMQSIGTILYHKYKNKDKKYIYIFLFAKSASLRDSRLCFVRYKEQLLLRVLPL